MSRLGTAISADLLLAAAILAMVIVVCVRIIRDLHRRQLFQAAIRAAVLTMGVGCYLTLYVAFLGAQSPWMVVVGVILLAGGLAWFVGLAVRDASRVRKSS